jgi:anti-sigma factor RsiW
VTAAHLDHEALADFAEGILDEDTATSTEEHLAACDDCRRRAAEVAEVSRVLARAPMPPMPAHLVDRLDAAIAAEAASHMPAHRSNRRFHFIAAAAAAVVLVGGGAAAVRTAMESGGTSDVGAQPPASDPSHSHLNQPMGPAFAVPFTVVHTGTAYTAAGLESQLAAAIAKVAKQSTMNASDAALAACVTPVSGGRRPLLVDTATYEGQAATVIALPGSDAGHTDVWILGPKCSATNSDVILHRQVTR